MRVRHTKRVRSKHNKNRKTRRNRRYRRRIQKGGWGVTSYSAKKEQKNHMMYGGWGPAMNSI